MAAVWTRGCVAWGCCCVVCLNHVGLGTAGTNVSSRAAVLLEVGKRQVKTPQQATSHTDLTLCELISRYAILFLVRLSSQYVSSPTARVPYNPFSQSRTPIELVGIDVISRLISSAMLFFSDRVDSSFSILAFYISKLPVQDQYMWDRTIHSNPRSSSLTQVHLRCLKAFLVLQALHKLYIVDPIWT